MQKLTVLLMALGLFLYGCCGPITPETQDCSDGTPSGSCASSPPLYCSDGELIQKASLCGCGAGYDVLGDSCMPHVDKCDDGTLYNLCAKTKPKYCDNGVLIDNASICGCPAGQGPNGSICSIMPPINYSTIYENTEPYYGEYCDKINPYDLSVRQAAADAIRNDSGAYSITQLFDIYDWVKANIMYQNVPLGGIPYPASETLVTKSGDCKNQAVLMVSMIRAISGIAKVVADPDCRHAYTIVRIGPPGMDMSPFTQAVARHYNPDITINYITAENGTWVIFDPAGGRYPGNTLPECSAGNRTVYFMTSCLDCANQYPNKPYTFGNSCYSKCPSGTITANQHACTSCREGYHSCDNECVSCTPGRYLGVDCMCYESCPYGTIAADDYTCKACQPGYQSCDNQCLRCPPGDYLGADCMCYRY
ncbi:MAG: transglutaminase-like domain-containing protein [Candidatus ainarchaeum sp.]|nr:transglutaminase-like domain-containing protein [Candidatus ainarchaeum sp.]